jgi:hypothetical protein
MNDDHVNISIYPVDLMAFFLSCSSSDAKSVKYFIDLSFSSNKLCVR